MEINKTILAEIREYCALNGIKDVRGVVDSCLRDGFNVLKYGTSPFDSMKPIEATGKPKEAVSEPEPITVKEEPKKAPDDAKKTRRVRIIKTNG